MKSQIIEQLGQTDILLPSLIGDGLAANDRVKARLSVLQAAVRHARDPQGSRFNLAEKCQAAGVDTAPTEALVNGAALSIDAAGRQARLAGAAFKHGDWLTIDGETGAIYLGRCRTRVDRPDAELAEIERWRSKVA